MLFYDSYLPESTASRFLLNVDAPPSRPRGPWRTRTRLHDPSRAHPSAPTALHTHRRAGGAVGLFGGHLPTPQLSQHPVFPPSTGRRRGLNCPISPPSACGSQATSSVSPTIPAATGRTGRPLLRALPPLQATDRPLAPNGRCQWREAHYPSRPYGRSSTATLCTRSTRPNADSAASAPVSVLTGVRLRRRTPTKRELG